MAKYGIIITLLVSFTMLNLGISTGDVAYFQSCQSNIPNILTKEELPYYSQILTKMQEPQLISLRNRFDSVFRFVYLRSRDVPIICRLEVYPNGSKWILTVKKGNSRLLDKLKVVEKKKVTLTKEQVHIFQDLFDSLGFWEIYPIGALETEYTLFDGSVWLFETATQGRCHFVRRLSPIETQDVWISDPSLQKEFDKLRKEKGYSFIDRQTNIEVNKKLVALGEYFIKMSSIELQRVY